MNHPTREDWVSYLYSEVSDEHRARLTNHLRECPSCAAQLNEWKTTAKDLDAFSLPRPEQPARKRAQIGFSRPAVQWAAAALILIGIGFGGGRLSSAIIDGRKLRAEIEPQLRQQLLQELQARRIEDNRAIYAALAKLDSRRLADYVSLKKELDTVAVLTDASLRNTEQQLAQLADYTQSTSLPDAPQKR